MVWPSAEPAGGSREPVRPNLIDNGLLLRSDIHTLFDRGYISVTPKHRILVSRKLKEEFDNGEPYYPLAGREIWLPRGADERPRAEFLEWHADEVFRG